MFVVSVKARWGHTLYIVIDTTQKRVGYELELTSPNLPSINHVERDVMLCIRVDTSTNKAIIHQSI